MTTNIDYSQIQTPTYQFGNSADIHTALLSALHTEATDPVNSNFVHLNNSAGQHITTPITLEADDADDTYNRIAHKGFVNRKINNIYTNNTDWTGDTTHSGADIFANIRCSTDGPLLNSLTRKQYVDNAVSNLQTQVTANTGKQPLLTATTNITTNFINALGVVTCNGLKLNYNQSFDLQGYISANGTTISATELSYLDNLVEPLTLSLSNKQDKINDGGLTIGKVNTLQTVLDSKASTIDLQTNLNSAKAYANSLVLTGAQGPVGPQGAQGKSFVVYTTGNTLADLLPGTIDNLGQFGLILGGQLYVNIGLNAVAGVGPSKAFAFVSDLTNDSLLIGPQGAAGAAGTNGINGAPGLPGVDGSQGLQGPAGVRGVAGVAGFDGPAGPIGSQGIKGDTGVAGAAGLDGAAGLPGADGSAGLPGAAGAAGLPGADGAAGLPGADGAAGLPGAAGIQGGAGADGAAGLPGAAGLQGAAGAAGVAGIQGAAGLPGAAGLKGDTGLTGLTGKGFTIYANYSSESLLVADDLHIGEFVLITGGNLYLNKGIGAGDFSGNTAFHYIGDITNDALLVGPQGPAGPAGSAGVAGVAGVAGSAGVAGTVGPAGASITGPAGVAGQSAIDYSTYGQKWISTGLVNATVLSSAISASGQYQLITTASKLYISNDYGVSWTINTTVLASGVGMSASGQYQSAGSGSMWYSSNYGATWTLSASTVPCCILSVFGDGQHQLATYYNSVVSYSSNYGVTWASNTTNAGKWSFVSSSSDKYATMCVYGGLIYNSIDYGVTWVASTVVASAITTYNWTACAMSSTGQYQISAVASGGIYYSSNYGYNWVLSNAPSLSWSNFNYQGLTMSANGAFAMIIVPNVGMYSSTDYGHTWAKTIASNVNWTSIAMSSTGQYMVSTMGFASYTSSATSAMTTAPAVLYNSISTASGIAYTLDYNVGATNILSNAPTANFSIRLNNCVASTTAGVFTITYNTIGKFYCNSVTCYDTTGTQIVLSSATPLFVGGTPALTSSTIIVQTFSLIRNFASNYVLSSVASYY